MSSILTNNGAMVALQTLKSINAGLGKTQEMISTGKAVGSAKDNSAVWAISKVMESDVAGFKAISESLSLGQSTVAVARSGAETIAGLLTDMKGKIVAAQQDNVDRAKLQTDVDALREQIISVVSAAQFNGLNLIDDNAATSVVSSLDRSDTGVTSSEITIAGQDLSVGAYTGADVFATGTAGSAAASDRFATSIAAAGTANIVLDGAAFAAGDSVNLRIGDVSVSYTVTAADIDTGNTAGDVIATNLKKAIETAGIADFSVDYSSGTANTLTLTNDGTAAVIVSGQYENAGSGGLGALAAIDVSTEAGADAALGSIETLIETAIDAAASFGSAQGRLSAQADFISSLTDSLKSGIGGLVDANMEETSAKLQALQVQQQLGIQSLSIANQAPQSILSLFR